MFKSVLPAFLLPLLFVGFTAAGFYMHGLNTFLQNVSPVAFDQFRQICESPNMTKSDVMSQLQNWATANSVRPQFDNATMVLQQRQQQMQSFVSSNMYNMTLQLFNQYLGNLTDMSTTRVAECQSIRNVMAIDGNTASNGQQQQQQPAMDISMQLLRQSVPVPPSTIPCPFYPQQCYRNIVPFVRRDEAAAPAALARNEEIVVEFVKMPENMQTHIEQSPA